MTELWDLYDRDFQPTGRTHRRGDPLQNGDYQRSLKKWLYHSFSESGRLEHASADAREESKNTYMPRFSMEFYYARQRLRIAT